MAILKSSAVLLALFASLGGPALSAPAPADRASVRIRAGITRAVSEHVHVIPAEGRPGVPNVGIVVGSRGVLIVDSGLGRASGETILAETQRIAGDRPLYVVATHTHPEHLGGEQAFPMARVMRSDAQQHEVETIAGGMIEAFAKMSADNALLLSDFAFRAPDIVFDGAITLDLGGVVVDIFPAGPAHTEGDIAIFVRDDGVLFTGDVVQQNYAPILVGEHSTPATWLAQIDRLEKLPARILVPSHTAITDRRAFGDMREMVVFVRDRWSEIAKMKLAEAAARDLLVADFRKRFPDCGNAALVRMSIPKL